MEIKFYKISDDRRKVFKTLNASTLVKTATGDIKSDCSIMDPIIEMSFDIALLQCNYMYIEDFGRYYHITNIETGAQRLFIHAHVDVLQTYSREIVELTCVIERQQDPTKCDLYLTDKAFKSENRHIISIRKFSGSFHKDRASYVLTTGGKS